MVKPGYKQTEIGVIPEDWEVKPAEDLMKIETGSRNTEDKVEGGPFPFFVRSQKTELIDTFHYNCEAVLTAGDGVGTGKVFHYYNGKFDAHQRVYVMSSFSGINGKFFYYYFGKNFSNEVSKMTAKTSVDSVRRDMIAKMPILVPPILQQNWIAEALSDVDELIASLERLIEKKKAIKQGAMQELLTGKRRLPGFSGEWCEVPIGEWGYLTKECVNPQLYPTEIFWEYSMPAYDEDEKPVKQVGKNMHSNRTRIKGTVLLFNKLNVRQKRIWYVENCGSNAVCSSEFLAYCSEKIDLRLVKYILGTDTATSDFVGMSTGTSNSQKRITPDCFLEYKISIPVEIKEQNAIADILENMDKECSVLEDKLEKARQIKQGMMQQLLTGKIRLA